MLHRSIVNADVVGCQGHSEQDDIFVFISNVMICHYLQLVCSIGCYGVIVFIYLKPHCVQGTAFTIFNVAISV